MDAGFYVCFLSLYLCIVYVLIFLQEIEDVLVSVLAVQTKAKQKNKQNWGNIRVLEIIEFIQIRHHAQTLSTSLIVDWD